MEPYEHIILATDGLESSQPTSESAFNIARENDATVTIVDTLVPPSTAARWFSANSDDVFEMVLADKQQRLKKIASRFVEGGVKADFKVLFGKSSEAICREAIESKASLVVRYMKGVRSKYAGVMGSTARSLMKYCHCPLLLVGAKAIEQPNVLACIDAEHDNSENTAVLMESEKLSREHANLHGLYCWDMYGAEMFGKRMDEDAFRETLKFNETIHRKFFEKFKSANNMSAFENGFRMEKGLPSQVIPEVCNQHSIDVVVMCSASLNNPFKRLMGSTIESVMDELPCSMMVVKPIGFVSPLKLPEVVDARS